MNDFSNEEIVVQERPPRPATAPLRSVLSDIPVALALAALALLLNYIFRVAGHFGDFSHVLLSSAEEMHFAAVARNIARGFGLVDSVIIPHDLFNFPGLPMPYLGKNLFPALLAPFMFLFPGQVGAVLPAWLSYGLLVGLTYLAARRYAPFFGALVVSVLVAVCPYYVAQSTRALPILPAAVLIMFFISGIVRKVRPLMLGFLWGLVLYLEPSLFILIPIVLPLTVTFGRKPRTPRFVLHFLVGWLAAVWPWLFRNAFVTDNPIYGYIDFSALWHLLQSPVESLSFLVAPAMVALCFLGSLWSRKERKRWLAGLGMIVILAFYGFFNFLSLGASRAGLTPVQGLSPEQVAEIVSRTSRATVIGSDVPEVVAWQCDRQTVALPADEHTFRQVNKIVSVDYLLFQAGDRSPILATYSSGGWFPFTYSEVQDGTDETDSSLLFQKRQFDIGKTSSPQLLHFRNTLALFQDNQIIHVTGPNVYEGPIACPPEVERVRWNRWTGGIYMQTTEGQIWTLGSAHGVPFVPKVGEIVDFCVTPSGKGCLFLMADGTIVAWGDAADLPQLPGAPVQAPFRIEITPSGKGYYVLSKYGTVGAFGDAVPGYSPGFYPQDFAADLAMTPDGKGYYILDVYGAIHNSSETIPLLLGRYDDHAYWAVDLEVLDDGSAYVLSDDRVLYHYKMRGTSE